MLVCSNHQRYHHLSIIFFVRPIHETFHEPPIVRKGAHRTTLLYADRFRKIDPRTSVTHAARTEPPRWNFPRHRSSCGLCRTTDIIDGMRESTCARSSRYFSASSRARLVRGIRDGSAEKERRHVWRLARNPRDAGSRGTATRKERERKREDVINPPPRQIRARSFLRAYAPCIHARVRDNLLVNVVIILKILLLLFSCRARRR